MSHMDTLQTNDTQDHLGHSHGSCYPGYHVPCLSCGGTKTRSRLQTALWESISRGSRALDRTPRSLFCQVGGPLVSSVRCKVFFHLLVSVMFAAQKSQGFFYSGRCTHSGVLAAVALWWPRRHKQAFQPKTIFFNAIN